MSMFWAAVKHDKRVQSGEQRTANGATNGGGVDNSAWRCGVDDGGGGSEWLKWFSALVAGAATTTTTTTITARGAMAN